MSHYGSALMGTCSAAQSGPCASRARLLLLADSSGGGQLQGGHSATQPTNVTSQANFFPFLHQNLP